MSINVSLDSFEGPLDLLLQLVRRSEISVWEIRIQTICEQFIEYTRKLETMDVELAGDFMVMAATLMRIKARMLLPRPEPEPEEETSQPLDEEEQLIARLLLYEGFREAAEQLELMADESAFLFTRGQQDELPIREIGDPLSGVTLLTLAIAVQQALKEVVAVNEVSVKTESYSLRGQMSHIRSLLKAPTSALVFRQLLSDQPSRLEIVVTFLAILELVRLQEIFVFQESPYSEVKLRRRDANASV